MELKRPTVLVHLMLRSSWGDVRITLPFLVMPGHTGTVVIGDKTLKEMLDVDFMRQLQATVEGRGIGSKKGSKTEERRSGGRSATMRRHAQYRRGRALWVATRQCGWNIVLL